MSEITAAKDAVTGEVDDDGYITGNLNAMYQGGWQLRGVVPVTDQAPYTHRLTTPSGNSFLVRIEDSRFHFSQGRARERGEG